MTRYARGRVGKSKNKSNEYETFDRAMTTILKARPSDVKAAMEAEKRERAEEQRRTGKRGRGRPPEHPRARAARASGV
jgi:hypothetical protein